MPYSSNIFDITISKVLMYLKPEKFFDFGAGAGKYGELIKKVYPQVYSVAVESEKDYINQFKLISIYNEVLNMSVLNFINPIYYDKFFDVVMIGDIIEHLRKSDGIDLLNFLVYRSKWIIVQFPYKYLQNIVNGHHSEAHISIWSESDFDMFETTGVFYKFDQRLIVIKGYIESNVTLKSVIEILKNNE